MAEIKGSVFAMVLFVAFVIPLFFTIGINSIYQHSFIKTTTEIADLVEKEGGITDSVRHTVNQLKNKNYTIEFKNKDGNPVTGKGMLGDTVHIDYSYQYKSVKGSKTLNTQNTVFITERNGTNKTTEAFDSTKTARFATGVVDYSMHIQTFHISGLKEVLNISTNTGNVEVIEINGDKVTVKMWGGDIVRSELRNGDFTPVEKKYVTNQLTQSYDDDGYIGKLEMYLHSGEYIPRDEKEVRVTCDWSVDCNNQYYEYSDAGGYRGTLYKNMFGTAWEGTAVRPEKDTRVWRFQGEVIKIDPDDTRAYKNFTQYDLTIQYR